MNVPANRVAVWLPAVMLAAAFVVGFTKDPNLKATEATRDAWQSPRVLAVVEEYRLVHQRAREREHLHPGRGKDIAGEVWSEEERLFAARLSYEDLRRLATSCEGTPVRFRDRLEFPARLLDFIVERFVAAGDRRSLVDLLAKRCVCRIGHCTDIEMYLAESGSLVQDFRGCRLRDGILVLGEAYDKCKEPQVRRDIAGAVRRGFACADIRENGDAEFVRKAMQWYRDGKESLAVNEAYWRNEAWLPLEVWDANPEFYDRQFLTAFKREPLFLKCPPGQLPPSKLLGVSFVWRMHAGIAVILTIPVILLGRKRARWRWWEMSAFILPFGVWAILMASEFSAGRKLVGNTFEARYIALTVPIAAIVQVALGPRVRQPWCGILLLVALCVAAAAIFFLVPPIWSDA